MPDWKTEIIKRLANVKLEPTREAEIVEELAQHLGDRYSELLASGATEDEALRVVLAELSDSPLLANELRKVERVVRREPVVWGSNKRSNMLGGLSQDLRYGVRMLRKNLSFTVVAVVTLALGIGANTAIFSVVNSVLLRPLPYEQPDRLVMIWELNQERSLFHERPAPGNFLDWRARNQVFDGLAAWYQTIRTLRGEQDAEAVQTAQVAGDFFQLLRVAPAVGQMFSPDQSAGASYNSANGYASGDRLAVISDRLWRRRFGADPNVVGSTFSLDGASWQIVAVLPPGFALPNPEVEIWTLWDLSRLANARDFRLLQVLARLKPDVSLEQAQTNLDATADALANQFPKANKGWGVKLVPLREELVGKSQAALLVLFGAVTFVLLLACANVASLLLVRASARKREMAVRAALGASRWRTVRQLLTESLLLSFAGGAVGLMLAFWGIKLLLAVQPGNLPRHAEIGLDVRVLVFTLVIAVVTGVVCGLAPAWQGSQTELTTALKEGGLRGATLGFRQQRFRSSLVAAEIAIALVLLVGAGLLTRSFVRVLAVNPGFTTEHLLVMPIFLDNNKYRTAAMSSAYYEQLIERLQTLPSVTSVGATTALPLSEVGNDFDRPYWREGEADPGGAAPKAAMRMVTPDYFRTMGIALQTGRNFGETDRPETPPVIVVNQTLERQVWPGQSAVGKRLVIWYNRGRYPYEVIGVVGDTRHYGLKREPRPEVFFAHAQDPFLIMNVVVRTFADPQQLTQILPREVLRLDPAQPAHSLVRMDHLLARSLAADRFAMWLLGAFAALALLLAASGIYGVLSFAVTERTHEIGIRVALGAQPSNVLRLVLAQGMKLALAGVLLGFGGAWALTRLMKTLLFGVSATDPLTFGLIALLLTTVALLACWIPARRATRVDPMVALRYE